ncbi:MAG: serine hydrolase [Planctomycetota bacterium]
MKTHLLLAVAPCAILALAPHTEAQALFPRRPQPAPYFPPTAPGNVTWATLDPAALGWDAAATQALFDFLEQTNSRSFVLLQGGKIVLERYFNGADFRSTQPVFSVTKSVTATQLGGLVEQGLVDLDAPMSTYLGLGWTQASPLNELQITVREVAQMTSGLDSSFLPVAAPGTVWFYNTPVYRELLDVFEAVSGLPRAEFTRQALLDPIGMHDTQYEPGGQYLLSSGRDLARFGLLVLRDGRWKSRQLFDPRWTEEMRTPSQDLNPAYGWLWWINGQDRWVSTGGQSGTGPLVPAAPADTTMALGLGDQKVFVVPSRDWVIVRQGGLTGSSFFNSELWLRIEAAAP